MAHAVAFPPILPEKARLLILGSMPGVESLKQQQYYAHPRNSFWAIMQALLDEAAADYAARVDMLRRHNVALWDVLQSCYREGSLDTSIRNDSIVVNDFNTLLSGQPLLRSIYFNGARAEQEFSRRVLPLLDEPYAGIRRVRLPSTSPAMASLTFEQKLSIWRDSITEIE